MKRLLPFFILFLSLHKTNAQVVFCPPGAEWHYGFWNVPGWGNVDNYENASIKYSGDSIIGSDTLKILKHSHFYTECNFSNEVKLTLLKQRRDTVFFKNNKTQGSWQILYNFACTPGTGWQTTFLNGQSIANTNTYIVSAVSNTIINGMNLKQLNVGGYNLTERLGWNSGFLFGFDSQRGCDGFYFASIFCYSDNVFGLKTFTDKPCGFSGIDNISKYSRNDFLKIYPNPTSHYLNIEFNGQNDLADCMFRIRSVLGEEVKLFSKPDIKNGVKVIDMQDLKSGLYFLEIFKEEALIVSQKVIKE